MSPSLRYPVTSYLTNLQQDIVAKLESLDPDGPRFVNESVKVSEDISTISFILQRTDRREIDHPTFAPIERAFLALSFVKVRMPTLQHLRDRKTITPNITFPPPGSLFFGAHLSVVVHPRSPHAPTIHANWRYFEIYDDLKSLEDPSDWWFGGTVNLSPACLYEHDCQHFHRALKNEISPYGEDTFGPMKLWCDEYFYNSFRRETRGVGGIFYDNLSSEFHPKLDTEGAITRRPKSSEECLAFFKSTGSAFVSGYFPILERRAFLHWTQQERSQQLVQRGRFVEYILLFDEGVKFNLQAGGDSIESMMLLLPETAQWVFSGDSSRETEVELELMKVLKEPRDWV